MQRVQAVNKENDDDTPPLEVFGKLNINEARRKWQSSRHVQVHDVCTNADPFASWRRKIRGGRGGGSTRGRLHATVQHAWHTPVSRVRNEFEGCAGCVRGRIVRVGYVQTRILLSLARFASPLVPLWPVENDTFRNCAVSLCEGTCRERAQSRAWYTRVNGYEEKRGEAFH